MMHLGEATDRDVLLAFLRAEKDSSRFGNGFTEAHAAAPVEWLRLLLGRRLGLVCSLPKDTRWQRVRLEAGDAVRLRYMHEPSGSAWVKFAGGSRRVLDGASHVGQRSIGPPTDAALAGIERRAVAGERMEDLIAVEGGGKDLILVEGSARATVYVHTRRIEGVTMLLGSSPSMPSWPFF